MIIMVIVSNKRNTNEEMTCLDEKKEIVAAGNSK